MGKEELIGKLLAYLKETLRKKDLQLDPEDNLMEKTGLDSMGAIEFIFKLEEEFDISIDDAEAQKIQTLNRAAELVLEKLAGKQGGLHENYAATGSPQV